MKRSENKAREDEVEADPQVATPIDTDAPAPDSEPPMPHRDRFPSNLGEGPGGITSHRTAPSEGSAASGTEAAPLVADEGVNEGTKEIAKDC